MAPEFIHLSLILALQMLGKKAPHPTPLLPSCPDALSGSFLVTPISSVLNNNGYQLELRYCYWLQREIPMISPSDTGQKTSHVFLHQSEGP